MAISRANSDRSGPLAIEVAKEDQSKVILEQKVKFLHSWIRMKLAATPPPPLIFLLLTPVSTLLTTVSSLQTLVSLLRAPLTALLTLVVYWPLLLQRGVVSWNHPCTPCVPTQTWRRVGRMQQGWPPATKTVIALSYLPPMPRFGRDRTIFS